MVLFDADTTNPTLLNRLSDWRDHEAWVDFVTRYDPLIRFSSRRYRLDAESTEELCQRVRTWRVFWNIAILGQSVREASTAAGITYYAAFAAEKRVGQVLREDGRRFLAEPRVLEPQFRLTGD